ncbi:MAG TPA: DUF305 domain-containing protein, partial [Nocardioides sp.]
MTRKIISLVSLLVALFALTACGGQEDERPSATRTAANGDTFNDADVAFATDMVQHHAQALQMVDMTLGRDLDPEVARLADEIRAAQGPEIETMTDWLTDWDQPIPETSRDHANAHGEGHAEMDGDMPGMMSADQMDELMKAPDTKFQEMWLEMMIEHHEGAVEMAQDQQEDGQYKPAVDLAGDVV